MAKDNSNSFNNNSSLVGEPDSNKSFVKKVQSRVSGLLPTSLSKWFGNGDNINKATVRQREDDDDDECYEIQPPSKKARMPPPTSLDHNPHMNSIPSSSFTVHDGSRGYNASTSDIRNHFRSTVSEPPAGPLGIKSRKLFSSSVKHYDSTENLLNGDKDSDSGESTSGYSSMVRLSHKDAASSGELKKADALIHNVNPNNLFNSSAFGSHSRSLFTERSVSPQINSSLSSRRPSFNASTFGSPNFIDRTLSTKRIINSPFYNGRTTYGGASAYGTQQAKSPKRSKVTVKPVNQSAANDNATLSKTARRILDTLEQYTSPVSDAKKIPNPLSKRPRPEGLLSKYTGANPYFMRASNKELQIPTVPDLLKMKLKERLQDSTVAVRQIATTSKSTLNSDQYTIRTVEEETPKHTNKIKSKISSLRQRPEQQPMDEVNLPNIALPITDLPKFDFTLPPAPSCSEPLVTVACKEPPKPPPEPIRQAPDEKIVYSKEVVVDAAPPQPTARTSLEDVEEYKFASPLVLAENLKSIIAINDFKFSEPVVKQNGKVASVGFKSPPMVNFKSSDLWNKSKPLDMLNNFKSPDAAAGVTLKRKNQNCTVPPAAQLLSGSVDEVLCKTAKVESTPSLFDKFKPAPGTWKCEVCDVRNQPDTVRCIACESPKSSAAPTGLVRTTLDLNTGFGKEFKLSTDQWECDVCCVRNAKSDSTCVSCTTPKPTSKKPNGPFSCSMVVLGNTFGDKFKPPSDTWPCPVCLVRNGLSLEKCMACETARPAGLAPKTNTTSTGFVSSFKKKSDEWTCPTCMVPNGSERNACACCETAKPGGSVTSNTTPNNNQPAAPAFTFGVFNETATNAQGFKINPLQSTKSGETIASVFGSAPTTTTNTTLPTFTFGIPPKNPTEATLTTKSQQESTTGASEKLAEKSTPPTGFVFSNGSQASAPSAASTIPKFQPPSKPEDKVAQPIAATSTPAPAPAPPVGFTFGNFTQPAKQPNLTKVEPLVKSETLSKPPVSTATGFTFGSNVAAPVLSTNTNLVAPAANLVTFGQSLKRTVTEAKLQETLVGGKRKDEVPSASIMFSPPQQPLTPSNKSDSNFLNKPTLPINGQSNKLDRNLVFSPMTSVQPTQPNNSFTFTPAKSQPVLPTTSTKTNLFDFGTKTTPSVAFGNIQQTTKETPAPVFKFGSNTPAEPPATQPGFSNMNRNMQPPAGNVFGNGPSSSIFGAPPKSMFEAPPAVAPTPPPPFGSPATPVGFGAPPSEIKPFSFGARPTSDTPPPAKAPAFSFGQGAKHPDPAKTPAFSFGNAAPSTGGGFSFSGNAAGPAPNVHFNYHAPKPDNPSPFQSQATSASNIFGAPSQVQPQPTAPVQNGGFNFGSGAANNGVKTGFNFGVAPAPPQFNAPQQPSGDMFNFGAPAANSAPAPVLSGGFNFGGGPPAPSFNANMKPTFNFTGGATPTFSAQPTADSATVAARKKIRAVRRTQR